MNEMDIDDKQICDKIASLSRKAGKEVVEKAITLYVLLREEGIPTWAKVAIAAALAYLVCPVDAVPDFLPAGLLDDLTIMVGTLAKVRASITPEVREKYDPACRSGARPTDRDFWFLMKKSSKNRLTPQQQALFPGTALFDQIARAVCRAGTLPRKELHEAWEMAKRVRRRYRGGRVLDLACGHGLLAHIMLILDDSSETAIAVDTDIPLNAEKLSQSLLASWPRLQGRIIYQQVSLQDITILPDDIVVSAHACGALTDLVIDRAVEQRARVAVLPCCHNLKESPTDNLEGWMDKTLAVDAVRAMRLRAKGYRIVTQKIPDDITPKNRLLMGEYRTR